MQLFSSTEEAGLYLCESGKEDGLVLLLVNWTECMALSATR